MVKIKWKIKHGMHFGVYKSPNGKHITGRIWYRKAGFNDDYYWFLEYSKNGMHGYYYNIGHYLNSDTARKYFNDFCETVK